MDMIAKISSSGLLTMILIAFHRTSAVLHKTSVTGSPPLRHIMPERRCPKICTVGVCYAVSFEILAALSAISLVPWLLLDLQIFRRLLRNLFCRDRPAPLESVNPPPCGEGLGSLFVVVFLLHPFDKALYAFVFCFYLVTHVLKSEKQCKKSD